MGYSRVEDIISNLLPSSHHEAMASLCHILRHRRIHGIRPHICFYRHLPVWKPKEVPSQPVGRELLAQFHAAAHELRLRIPQRTHGLDRKYTRLGTQVHMKLTPDSTFSFQSTWCGTPQCLEGQRYLRVFYLAWRHWVACRHSFESRTFQESKRGLTSSLKLLMSGTGRSSSPVLE